MLMSLHCQVLPHHPRPRMSHALRPLSSSLWTKTKSIVTLVLIGATLSPACLLYPWYETSSLSLSLSLSFMDRFLFWSSFLLLFFNHLSPLLETLCIYHPNVLLLYMLIIPPPFRHCYHHLLFVATLTMHLNPYRYYRFIIPILLVSNKANLLHM
jgi:hypothetical protein